MYGEQVDEYVIGHRGAAVLVGKPVGGKGLVGRVRIAVFQVLVKLGLVNGPVDRAEAAVAVSRRRIVLGKDVFGREVDTVRLGEVFGAGGAAIGEIGGRRDIPDAVIHLDGLQINVILLIRGKGGKGHPLQGTGGTGRGNALHVLEPLPDLGVVGIHKAVRVTDVVSGHLVIDVVSMRRGPLDRADA